MEQNNNKKVTTTSVVLVVMTLCFANVAMFAFLSGGFMNILATSTKLVGAFNDFAGNVSTVIENMPNLQHNGESLLLQILNGVTNESMFLAPSIAPILLKAVCQPPQTTRGMSCNFINTQECKSADARKEVCLQWQEIVGANGSLNAAKVLETLMYDANFAQPMRLGDERIVIQVMLSAKKIRNALSDLTKTVEEVLPILAYTRDFGSAVKMTSTGLIQPSTALYVSLGAIGAPIPFTFYYVYRVSFELAGIDHESISPKGIEFIESFTPGTKRDLSFFWRAFFIQLWKDLVLEIAMMIVCSYPNYFSPLYAAVEWGERGMTARMKKSPVLYKYFSALPVAVWAISKFFNTVGYYLALVSLSVKIFLAVLAVIGEVLVLTTGAWVYIAGFFASLFSWKRGKWLSIGTMVLFFLIEYYMGEWLKIHGLSLDMSHFDLGDWMENVPFLVRTSFEGMPFGAKSGFWGLVGFMFTKVASDAMDAVAAENENVSALNDIKSGLNVSKKQIVFHYIQQRLRGCVSMSKYVIWGATMIMPIATQVIRATGASQGVNWAVWIADAALVPLSYLF